jgi:hypothetical protein
VRLAIANAAVLEGRKVGQWEISAEVGAKAAGTGCREAAGTREIGGSGGAGRGAPRMNSTP